MYNGAYYNYIVDLIFKYWIFMNNNMRSSAMERSSTLSYLYSNVSSASSSSQQDVKSEVKSSAFDISVLTKDDKDLKQEITALTKLINKEVDEIEICPLKDLRQDFKAIRHDETMAKKHLVYYTLASCTNAALAVLSTDNEYNSCLNRCFAVFAVAVDKISGLFITKAQINYGSESKERAYRLRLELKSQYTNLAKALINQFQRKKYSTHSSDQAETVKFALSILNNMDTIKSGMKEQLQIKDRAILNILSPLKHALVLTVNDDKKPAEQVVPAGEGTEIVSYFINRAEHYKGIQIVQKKFDEMDKAYENLANKTKQEVKSHSEKTKRKLDKIVDTYKELAEAKQQELIKKVEESARDTLQMSRIGLRQEATKQKEMLGKVREEVQQGNKEEIDHLKASLKKDMQDIASNAKEGAEELFVSLKNNLSDKIERISTVQLEYTEMSKAQLQEQIEAVKVETLLMNIKTTKQTDKAIELSQGRAVERSCEFAINIVNQANREIMGQVTSLNEQTVQTAMQAIHEVKVDVKEFKAAIRVIRRPSVETPSLIKMLKRQENRSHPQSQTLTSKSTSTPMKQSITKDGCKQQQTQSPSFVQSQPFKAGVSSSNLYSPKK